MPVTPPIVDISGANVDQTLPFATTVTANNFHAPAANTAATVTITADSAKPVILSQVFFSYAGSGTLAGGNLIVENGAGTTVFSIDIESKGVYEFTFQPALASSPNTALIVTLAAGGANVSGKVVVNPIKHA